MQGDREDEKGTQAFAFSIFCPHSSGEAGWVLQQIAVAPNGQIWGVNSANDIFTRQGPNGGWQQIAGKLAEISIGTNGMVWGVNPDGHIYKRKGINGAWEHLGKGLMWVSSQ